MTTSNLPPSATTVRAETITAYDIECDVAVVGFGGAGACAAIEAADAGANVHIFEVSSAAGGSTALSGGEFYLGGNGGTSIQKQFGFADTSEDMFGYLMLQQGLHADEAKIHAYVDGAVEHFEWLVNLGVPFKESFIEGRVLEPMTDDCLFFSGNEKAWPACEQFKPAPRAHAVKKKGMGAGSVLMESLTLAIEQRDIAVHLEARALRLIVDADGAVQGMVVRMDGRELMVKAKRGVILCAGGFIMNETMVKKHAPQLTRCDMQVGNPGDMGNGIEMGISVGAATLHMNEGHTGLPFYPPPTISYGLLVNDKGQRFVNEDAYQGRVGATILNQFSTRVYFILDVEAYGDYEALNFMAADVAGTGETLEELGLIAGSLVHTMAVYNEHAANGEDPYYHKQPEWLRPLKAPYVALDVTPGRGAIFTGFTLGGLDTLPNGQALRLDGSVIKGLYAAGRTACGVPRRGEGYNSGLSVGDATFSGRRAGEAVAGETVA